MAFGIDIPNAYKKMIEGETPAYPKGIGWNCPSIGLGTGYVLPGGADDMRRKRRRGSALCTSGRVSPYAWGWKSEVWYYWQINFERFEKGVRRWRSSLQVSWLALNSEGRRSQPSWLSRVVTASGHNSQGPGRVGRKVNSCTTSGSSPVCCCA